ncbi:MAG: B12-binding domain-containing radical SAM protein [Thermoplasmata archaeon YP2-bin.285]|uniref:B12-binding domain-containing radical SAM protein n=1 Tax=Candidatus Sysuiplasma superficiale TaxID=2823368 RepID=A0A8J7YQF6_9ARCH|nr:B12-binding domain-containing radical SAM protein [Candidatus Sysuiplasma superficiale]
MTKYVLVSDATLSYDFRNFPLLDFLPCAPSNVLPEVFYDYLKGSFSPALPDGRVKYAPYSVRKLEAALLSRNRREDVAVAHEDHLENFIRDDTEIIGVSTMDPLGTGPLTVSYMILFESTGYPWVRREWYRLMSRINAVRKGKKAKLVVGGPGVWEFTLFPEELERCGIDYAFQGESDDVVCDLFEQISQGVLDSRMFYTGYMSFDDHFHRQYRDNPRFITRKPGAKNYPSLDEIPDIVEPTMKSMTEIMRGCGIGCDFCEVTLRPSRYYPIDKIIREVNVNVKKGGYNNAWLHTDEIFAYKHGRLFEPNEEALTELFSSIMAVPGVEKTNPTHGRISIPAAYPDLIKKLSTIMKADESNWIGVQVGVETGSERLAKIHMPNKTLPLRIGSDGSWQDIVWWGVHNFNRYYWRPAFTCQVGQNEETDEDNWETVELINRLSNSMVDHRPFEFTITPMQNVPLGLIKSREFSQIEMNESQLAVYYASYRHLAKMAARDSAPASQGNILARIGTSSMISIGGWIMLRGIEHICKKRGLDIDKVKRFGLESGSLFAKPVRLTS